MDGKLLYVGRIDARKGIDAAVRALAELPDGFTLTVVGHGHAGHLRELVQIAHGLSVADRVELLPGRPRAELPETYAAHDAVLFPVRWAEPWGLVPLEAMEVGRPVVASGRGGSGEYLRDGENSLLADPDRPATIAAAVQRLADDAQLRARLRAGGFATAREHPAAGFEARVIEAVETAGR
jgi:glycosyltransferase involved in cell wall biosynthesis